MNSNTVTAAVVGDIRDIRPPIHIPCGWLWVAYVAGALVIAGAAYAIWRKRKAARHQTLAEITLAKLEAARKLMSPELAYTFSITVSEIVRDYIEWQLDARAAHRTTEEFLHDLMTFPALLPYQDALGDFLEHCDLAKFARWQLSVHDMEAMHQSACAFVAETSQPAPQPEKVTA